MKEYLLIFRAEPFDISQRTPEEQMGSMEKFITDVPGVALTNAGKNKRIVRFEEHDLIYFGPRTGENIIKLMKLIHPPANAQTK